MCVCVYLGVFVCFQAYNVANVELLQGCVATVTLCSALEPCSTGRPNIIKDTAEVVFGGVPRGIKQLLLPAYTPPPPPPPQHFSTLSHPYKVL